MIWMSTLFRIVLTVIVVVGAIIYFFQERVIFYPSKLPADFKFNFKNTSTEKVLTVGKSDIHSLYFEAKDAPGVIVYFHGNAGSLEGWGELASDFVDQTGWNIWMVDYPGYGKSTGHITSESQLHSVADAVFAEAIKLNPGKKVVIYGRSLGSGMATALAAKENVDGVVLETPFYNVEAMAKNIFPFVPGFLVRYKLASNESMKHIKAPIMVIHGTADEIVPFDQGKRLYDEHQGPKTFVEIKGGDHNSLDSTVEFWPAVIQFLKSI